MQRRSLLRLIPIVMATIFLGCDSEEVAGHGHTPDSAQLFAGSTELTPDVILTAGQTVRIEVRFIDEHGEVIADLEDTHVAGLTFDPAAIVTIAAVTGQPFFFDVTVNGAAGATGTVTVGYGHDAPTDLTFGPFDVMVQ